MDQDKVTNSSSYSQAQSKASEYAEDSEKLENLLIKATHKAEKKEGLLADVWESLQVMFRLLKAYSKGEYRDMPWQSLLLIISAVVYFVMPIDFIPDIIVSLGFVDDAALIAWAMKAIKTDVEAFLQWEQQQKK